MLRSILCDYSDAYRLLSGTITVVGAGPNAAAITANRNNKQAIFQNWTPFIGCTTEINSTQVKNT